MESQKFNPLRAKADSFGFRRGYFLKIKIMTLEKVIKRFENAEKVKCISTGRVVDISKKVTRDIHLWRGDFWIDLDSEYYIPSNVKLYDEFKGFAKILTTKQPSFSITKEQLRQLTDPKVKEWFSKVFKVKLKFGKWYKSANSGYEKLIVNVVSIEGNKFTGYGIDNVGRWLNEYGWELNNPIEATEKEVFEALKNEAVKRGFVEGAYFEGLDYRECTLEGTFFLFKNNILYASDVFKHIIFNNGNWATIIPSITKSEAEKLLNKKIID